MRGSIGIATHACGRTGPARHLEIGTDHGEGWKDGAAWNDGVWEDGLASVHWV